MAPAFVFSNVRTGLDAVDDLITKSVSSHVKSADPVTLSASEKKATLSPDMSAYIKAMTAMEKNSSIIKQ